MYVFEHTQEKALVVHSFTADRKFNFNFQVKKTKNSQKYVIVNFFKSIAVQFDDIKKKIIKLRYINICIMV